MVAPLGRSQGGIRRDVEPALRTRVGTLSGMNVAVLVTGGISETLQATPLLRTLRAGVPQARLTLFCPASARLVAAGIPPVDDAVALASLEGRAGPSGACRVWGALRRRRLDAVLLCSTQAALRIAAFLAGVPQ